MIKPKKITGGSDLSLITAIKTYKYQKDYLRDNPDMFLSFGTLLYCGEMGSGKSLSAHHTIKYLKDVKPDLLVISNVNLSYCDFVKYHDVDTIRNASNGNRGIIVFFDEIQNQFPSIDSKQVARDFVEICSFLRKYKILLIGTAPLFSRIAKPFRESFEYVVFTDNILGLIQHNQYYKCNIENKAISGGDEESAIHNMKLEYNHYFVRSVDDFNRYDTSEAVKVIRG